MSTDEGQFKKFKSLSRGSMIFWDGSTTTIEGKESIDILGFPTFHGVLFVNGNKALLSINQFYDENHNVQFSKNECKIYIHVGKWVIKVPKS